MRKFFLFFFLLPSVFLNAQLEVVSIFPLSQSLTATTSQPITLVFSEPVNPTTLQGMNVQVFGRWSGPMDFESMVFDIENTSVTLIPSGEFMAGEMVTVLLTKNVATPNNVFLTHGYSFSFWIKTALASLNLDLIQTLEMKLPGEGLIQCYGAYAGDLNDDGYSDLAVVNENANDIRVLHNDGSGTYPDQEFIIYPMPSGNKPSPSEGADFNHDGFIDLAVSHVLSDDVSVLMGDGQGGFLPEVGYTAQQAVRGLAIIDFEADGFADIVTANRSASSITLLHNNGEGIFEESNSIDGMSNGETAIAVADANEDGIMDIFVGSYTGGEVFIMLNDGEGNFSEGGITDVEGQAWMITIGDVNNDGHVDLVSANSTGNNCSVHLGDGEGGFLESTTYETGNFPLAIDLGDLDGDGDLDMITSNYSGNNYTLFENDGEGNFVLATIYDANSAGSCAIFHDRDNDGTLDLSLVDEVDDVVFIYRNHSTVSVEEISQPEVRIAPNPFNEEVTIEIKGVFSEKIKITNALGKIVQEIDPLVKNGNTYYVWNSTLGSSSGLYFAKFQGKVFLLERVDGLGK